MESEAQEQKQEEVQARPTLLSLIDSIEFEKKPKAKSNFSLSETDSISSNQSIESKEKSKLWTHEQVELFHLMLKKYGTDFHILSNFFPKKTKNQLKNRYKQYMSHERKREKEQIKKLQAVSKMFAEVEEKYERDERDEKQEKDESDKKQQKLQMYEKLQIYEKLQMYEKLSKQEDGMQAQK